jgi:small-conductance mechanosensitive channel
MRMPQESLGFGGVTLRTVFALVLVLATYNPSGRSYYHWIAPDFPSFDAVPALAGLALLTGWVVFLRATLRSLGLLGMLLAFAVCAALVWVAVDFDWVELESGRAIAWIALVIFGLILGVGMSWSHIRRRLSGQADVDEIDSR